ncbi:MAG: prepilin-type N-terminal cleavage/methylation domain-containing protein, partial [Kiritimatiellaceae bacterium]|nr:prepilin-type N-terminal cleavage/methylation domain-containing protein [Kiritimatiellaceae bacterium]
MRTTRKSGFTLVELMIVAAIIAILAAILIPLLSSNKDSAIASEAANICGSVATEMKTYYARTGTWPTKTQLAAGIIDEEVNKARYFNWGEVFITATDNWAVRVTGDGAGGSSSSQGFSDGVNTLTLSETGSGPVYG